ncbi:PREDICTED: uncharacterized protein LOC104585886 [Nelumbo nucifera]|uniref:SMP-30/Gluconolactonase/LRE-like region domain-containing protein n=2 Tax=Nelumbo nucifera TaxID=4432 RepID=A0A822Y6S9_NELNU|nr:PREDICTED: uncharacterized protein LOC104585886 [Nelumbo nucifera]DAD29694.1 TPA_asm: hypothetical protein HUJ06_031162 [Nelumbo nucifera]
MHSVSSKTSFFFLLLLLIAAATSVLARKRHVINFQSPNLFPEGVAWDPAAQHFVVGSFNHRSINAVSDAGVVESLISDTELPPNVAFVGLAVDSVHRRLLATIHAIEPFPDYNALAAYDLRSRKRIFLAPLTNPASSDRQIANAVAVDYKGNAYVTNSAGNFIWKVSVNGEPSIFSRSPLYTSQQVDRDQPYSFCGLNGIAYLSKGYLLVVQSNTGKMFKVNADDGTARLVLLRKDLTAADGIAVRSDGVAVVVSQHKAWLLKSDDSWGEAVVYDEIALDAERFPTSVTIREDNRAYVIYGHVDKGILGEERDEFSIQELEWAKESEEEAVWVFVLIGLGLAYFMYWRFQMGQLIKNMNKKTD